MLLDRLNRQSAVKKKYEFEFIIIKWNKDVKKKLYFDNIRHE